jgi:hypothetical protein
MRKTTNEKKKKKKEKERKKEREKVNSHGFLEKYN